MFRSSRIRRWIIVSLAGLLLAVSYAFAQQGERGQSSYMPVDIAESFASLMARLSTAKPGVEQEHNALLNERYDLSDRPAQGVQPTVCMRTAQIRETPSALEVKGPGGGYSQHSAVLCGHGDQAGLSQINAQTGCAASTEHDVV